MYICEFGSPLCVFVPSSIDSADIMERLQRTVQVSAHPTCRSAPPPQHAPCSYSNLHI